jgi:ABC-type multidrug transport system fused ATPase/permease subunit
MRVAVRDQVRRYARLRRYAFRFADVQAGALVSSLIGGAAGVVTPYLTKLTFDYAYANRDLALLLALAGAGLLLALFSTGSGLIQRYLQLYVGQSLAFELRADFVRHIYSLPLSFFHSRSTGEHVYRLNSDVTSAASLLGNLATTLLNPVTSLIFPLSAVLWLDWRFAVVAAALAPIYALHSRYFGSRQRALARRLAKENQDASSDSVDRISQIKLVKSLGRERYELRRYLGNQIRLIRLGYRQYWLDARSTLWSSLINTALQCGLLLYLGCRVVAGEMTVGTLIALSMYFSQLVTAVRGLAGFYQSLLSQLIPVDRLLEVLEVPQALREPPRAVRLCRLSGAVSFGEVDFSYTSGVPVLGGLSFEIRPQEMVAIVGPSGVGKSTIVSLLLRLYDPDAGAICVDGYDLRSLQLTPYRNRIGLVLQETFLFNTSIMENIRYGNPEATDAEVLDAARRADAHAFVEQLPDGYETLVGEQGCTLSVGQRQRVGIARALVRRPQLVVLDEATASLSSESEASVLGALRPAVTGATLMVITHRLTAIHRADRILVIDAGRVAEQGTHLELVAQGGIYHRLWESQFGREGPSTGAVRDRRAQQTT